MGTWALGHSALEGYFGTQGTQGTWPLGYLRRLGTRRALRHSGTRASKALGHLGTQALGHSGTRKALGHSSTVALNALEALYLADSP